MKEVITDHQCPQTTLGVVSSGMKAETDIGWHRDSGRDLKRRGQRLLR